MTKTRRSFLGTAAGLTANAAAGAQPTPLAQVPKVKFGKVEISRIVLGSNMLYGVSHFNQTYSQVMREWFTPAKVVEVMHRCTEFGINALQILSGARSLGDYERFVSEGGKFHLIVQASRDPKTIVDAMKPLAIYHAGEFTDNAWREGKMEIVKDYCKQVRQLGSMVGVGSHIPEVLAEIESQNWDVDFYAGCVYNRRRTPEELRKILGGELPESPNEVYLQDDPPRMYKFMRQTRKPCFAFKVLGAGRVAPEQGFRLALESIKPYDSMFVGMFPRTKDEVKENAEIVSRLCRAS